VLTPYMRTISSFLYSYASSSRRTSSARFNSDEPLGLTRAAVRS